MMTIIEGVVEHGDARGRTLGFPTANLALTDPDVEDGVWAGQVHTGADQWFLAAVSVGRRETFYAGEGQRLVEAHILDFDGDLYGQRIRVELMDKVRDQQSFTSVEALVAQMHRDVESTRAYGTTHLGGARATTRNLTFDRALV